METLFNLTIEPVAYIPPPKFDPLSYIFVSISSMFDWFMYNPPPLSAEFLSIITPINFGVEFSI